MPDDLSAHALATVGTGNICIVLSPSHEIKVFAEGVQMFSFRNARWHLLDIEGEVRHVGSSVGNGPLAERLFQTALDLADAREGRCSSCCATRRVAAAAGRARRSAGRPPRAGGTRRRGRS